ncbi:MAG TPA: nucleotidyltransferase domain-containing protein [Saprospiraceae bacterium]|nr:nucleotidyltransferase domain-containing protein [Saprospiraceae bacterium]
MATLSEIRNILKENKPRLTKKYDLSYLAIFGSYGREQQNAESDVDILVDFQKPIGIEFIDLALELENLLNLKVDLVSRNGIKPKYFKEIDQDLCYV